jgi:protein O-mannosyl-transferase
LAAVSAFAIRAWRIRPYFTVGWLWYLGTLVPVIGFVQVGGQAHADRYMYIPMIGLSIMLAWGAADAAKRWPHATTVLVATGVIFCAACAALAWTEASYWKDNETLYTRAIQVTRYNSVAENNLGMHYMAKQRPADALPHFEAAVRVSPDFADAHGNLGFALSQIPARASEAGKAYETALRLAPNNAEAHNGLGGVLMRSGDCAGAIPHFAAALKAKPDDALANYNLGGCQMTGGNYAAAVPYFEAAVRSRPGFAEAQASLASSLARIPGRTPDAIKAYEAVLQLNANEGLTRQVHARLGMLLADEGRTKEAIIHLETVQRPQSDPAIAKVLDRLRANAPK